MSRRRAIIDAQAWLALSWAAVAVFAAALAALLSAGRWPELRMTSAFFVPLLALMFLPHGLPNLILALSSACLLVSAAGWALDWYALHWWFDVVLHALNPLVITAGSMFMIWKADLVGIRWPGRFVLISTALGFALGVAWELIEVTYLDLTWPDTILDLVMDLAGSALGGWLALWIIRARGQVPLGRRSRPQGSRLSAVPARVSSRR